MLDQISER